jgi:hypothetical protein
MQTQYRNDLLKWINTHDCGVTPIALITPSGEIAIRVLAVHSDGTESIETTIVSSYAEARDALGY